MAQGTVLVRIIDFGSLFQNMKHFTLKYLILSSFSGHQYAMFSMKVMVSAILRHFKLSTDLKMSDLELEFGVALKLANEHMIRVERRNWN